jgi:TLC domain
MPEPKVSLTLTTAVVLALVRYLVVGPLFEKILGWPSKLNGATNEQYVMAQEAMAGATAMLHSMTLVPSLALVLLYSNDPVTGRPFWRSHPAATMEYTNHPRNPQLWWWNPVVNILLQFCTGYMIYDAICTFFYFKWVQLGESLTDSDVMFLGHHAATAIYMTSTRIVGAGHISAMICMFLGEFTNPFHNGHDIMARAEQLRSFSSKCCFGSSLSIFVKHLVTICFGLSYVAIRAVIAPAALVYVTYDLWKRGGASKIPLVLRLLWTLLIWGVVFGSIPWIEACYNMLLPYWAVVQGLLFRSRATLLNEL